MLTSIAVAAAVVACSRLSSRLYIFQLLFYPLKYFHLVMCFTRACCCRFPPFFFCSSKRTTHAIRFFAPLYESKSQPYASHFHLKHMVFVSFCLSVSLLFLASPCNFISKQSTTHINTSSWYTAMDLIRFENFTCVHGWMCLYFSSESSRSSED